MSTEPIVSVIVPMHNAERYIKKCVDSILEQTLRRFEIILVDDASSDGTFELCRTLYAGNAKINLLRHEKTVGTAQTRNTGMKNAHGKYICFVNGEDFILPSALKKFYTAAENFNADVVHAAGRFELKQDDVEPVRKENLHLRWDAYSKEGLLDKRLMYKLEEHWRKGLTDPDAWLFFCRRDFLERWGINFLNIAAADETFSFALFCLTERYYVLHATFYVRRILSESAANDTQKYFDGFHAMIIGASYIGRFLDHVPHFNGYDLWRENILAAFFQKATIKYTAPYNKNFLTNAALNAAADKLLEQFAPQAKSFTKYFFDAAHAFNRQVDMLTQINNSLSAQTLAIFTRMDISRNKIVFVNFDGKGYGCNPKYIAEEILRRNLPFDLVWLVNDENEPLPEKIRKARYGTLDSMFELATAKIIVTNTRKALPFPQKKDGQFFIMTWHSGLDFKRVEQDAEDKLPAAYIAEAKATAAVTDLMTACTQEQFDEFRKAFWYDGEILKCGLPRNDIFFRRDDKLVARLKKSLNVPHFDKVVLYAPTHRDKPAPDVYSLDAKKLLDVLEEKFGGGWTLVTRLHPAVSEKFDARNAAQVIDATAYPDAQELILIADVIISDYSSVIFDGMCAGKKIFLYAKDFDAFTTERGLKPLYFDLPYKINRTEAELFADIEKFDAAAVEPQVKQFMDKVKPFDTGHAAADVVALMQTVVANA